MLNRDEIVAAVRERGYFDGWDDEQLIARNVVKLVEEVCEALSGAGILVNDREWWNGWDLFAHDATEARRAASRIFDFGACGEVSDRLGLISELHDVYVVLSVLESLLGVDIATGALDKARGDVERGVR